MCLPAMQRGLYEFIQLFETQFGHHIKIDKPLIEIINDFNRGRMLCKVNCRTTEERLTIKMMSGNEW